MQQKERAPKKSAEASRPGLSIDIIVDTACELIAESGTEQLTMRKLSERLGVALGATYHYVPNRDGLLTLVAERINKSIPLRSTDPKEWRSTLRALLIDFATTFARYPGMANFHVANVEATGPAGTRDELQGLMRSAGFSTDSFNTVLAALFFYAAGVTATGLLDHDQPGLSRKMVLRSFEEGVDMLLDGAAVRLRSDKKARRERA